MRRVTAEALLAHGPKGGPGSPQAKRHNQILLREAQLLDASDRLQNSPRALHEVLSSEATAGTPAAALAQNRLATALLDRVKYAFLETALAEPRSDMRTTRLKKLRSEVERARPLGLKLSADMQDKFRQFEVDANALEAVARAQVLKQEAMSCAKHLSELSSRSNVPAEDVEACLFKVTQRTAVVEDPYGEGLVAFMEKLSFGEDEGAIAELRSHCKQFLPPDMEPLKMVLMSELPSLESGKVDVDALKEKAMELKNKDREVVVIDAEGNARKLVVPLDAVLERAREKAAEMELKLTQDRGRLVGETMAMLRTWKSHSQVAHELCDALLAMAESGGEAFLEEMERRGLAVLASTVADFHKARPDVARCALRLLSTVSIESLVAIIEENLYMENVVMLGLEALNKRVREGPDKLNELAKYGGREMLDELEPCWESNKLISLHILNMKRRLRRSNTKSIKRKVEVQMPPEDVVKLRGCFEAFDPQGKGFLTKESLGQAMIQLGIKFDEAELDEASREVDIDGSGMIEWPEFLFLMSKFGTNFSIEARFSEERLKEMRQVFEHFDADNSGTLDISELRTVMMSVGLSPEDWELRAMIAEVDADESGVIDWPEFLYLMSKKNVDAENQQRLAFEFFLEPNDKSGRIRRERFIQQMRRLTKEFTAEELGAMMFQAKFENTDASHLTYREFVKMMMSG